MRSKKVLIGFLMVTIMLLSAATTFAADKEEKYHFKSFTGIVKEISDFRGIEGSKIILVENENGGVANFIISEDTYIVGNAEIAKGKVITGYYRANVPMIMIYPPQYSAKVVVVDSKEENIKVDKFDRDLVSSDNSLKLNISESTEIILQDGKLFVGELVDRELVVFYDVSTKSIPAQTSPKKIVVLFEEESLTAIGDVSTMDIIVNNEKIEAPAAYPNEQGTVMVPLRAIAEALGFDVRWDDNLQSIMLGKGISLKIGEDNYIYYKTAPIQLGTAPALVEGTTFVPLSFFKEVVRMNNAYVFESQIVIDDEELME